MVILILKSLNANRIGDIGDFGDSKAKKKLNIDEHFPR